MPKRPPSAPRAVALVGPYQSGKTTLLESLLWSTGAIERRGVVTQGSAVGDRQPAAREHEMGVELNVAHTQWLGDHYTFLDCPGSVMFSQDTFDALRVADAAVVVCEPSAERVVTLAPVLHFLDEQKIPHSVFINKIDQSSERVKDIIEALRTVSGRPLVMREVPIRENGEIAGFVDLVTEQAWHFRRGAHSEAIEMPTEIVDAEHEAREAMVEALADFDDDLLEQVLEDIMPSQDEINAQLAKDVAEDLLVPVFFGSALESQGVSRLMKALRHETPEPHVTAARLGIEVEGDGVAAEVFKTYHVPHLGKLSMTRVWRGEMSSSQEVPVGEETLRLGGLYQVMGDGRAKAEKATVGDVVGVARADVLVTGAWLGNPAENPGWDEPQPPLYAMALRATRRADEVKLLGALQTLAEDDPSLGIEQNGETHELVVHGLGSLHLKVVQERLKTRFNIEVDLSRPHVPYKETISKSVEQAARFKRQTGGHGQFADIKVKVRPLARGAGFEFEEKITGGVVPKRFIPAVEAGCKEAFKQGPLGFPVVDLAVTLHDGQFHAVDSSDMAFKTCATMAMREALPQGQPVLLEPMLLVQVAVPNNYTAGVQRAVSSRRGTLIDYAQRPNWSGWDLLTAHIPQAEMHDMIQDLRSTTLGVGTYTSKFDHFAEVRDEKVFNAVVAG